MNTVYIVTGNRYPEGDAGAIRQHTMAKMLQSIGYNPIILGMGNTTESKYLCYDGVTYKSLRKNGKSYVSRVVDRLAMGIRAYKEIKRAPKDVKAVLIIDVLPLSFRLFESYGKKNGIVLIHDSVEWYSPEEFKHGKLSIQYLLKEYTNNVAINKNWNVIAISSYLYNHFLCKAKKTVQIPVIMEMEKNNYLLSKNKSDKIVFCYAGSPGKKDYLCEIIKGFALLSKEDKNKVEVHIIGVNKELLLSECGVSKEDMELMGNRIVYHGRLSHEQTVSILCTSDFSLLLRNPELRYSKAGFPTKVVESLKYGIPPMCNISSDLGDFLEDRYNAIIIDGYTADKVTQAVQRIINIPKEKRIIMQTNARKTAATYFVPERYLPELKEVLLH